MTEEITLDLPAFDEIKRNKSLAKIARKIGNEPTVVLAHLIETLPDRMVMIDEKLFMRPDKGAYAKLGIDSKRYYECINILVGSSMLVIQQYDRANYYRINFEELSKYIPEEYNEGP